MSLLCDVLGGVRRLMAVESRRNQRNKGKQREINKEDKDAAVWAGQSQDAKVRSVTRDTLLN